jgi:phytoene desaturase
MSELALARRTAPRAAIVGSGLGGLGAAIRLQSAGFSTVLFEARDQIGGRASCWRQDGFTFDAGPTVVTAPHTLEELFEGAGRRLSDYMELLPVHPFYRLVWEDGDRLDYDGDLEQMAERIAARSPGDAEGYRRFAEYSKRVFAKGYGELISTPFLRFFDMVRVAPALASVRADRSVYAAVSKFVKDEHLRQALSFHALLVGGNPFETSAIYTLIHHLERTWGITFPRGGTNAMVSALAKLYGDLGGELRVSCPVEHAVVDAGRHRLTTPRGEEVFDLVVSNADVHHTYATMYRGHPAAAKAQRKLERAHWSMSLFILYFGTDRTYDVAHHTVLFGKRYEELLRDIFHGTSLPDDFALYLHAPSVTDPSLAPPGCSTFYVLSPVPHLGHAPVDWAATATPYGDRLLAALDSYLPDVAKHVVTRRHVTPRFFESELAAYRGAAFSVAPTLFQSAYFRPHNRASGIPNLYLVGAGTHPGAGLPGVLNSAKATARVVLEDFAIAGAPR